MESWNAQKSQELYCVPLWGEGYFSINAKGNVVVRPSRNGAEIDLFEAIESIVRRGVEPPVLVRFDGIIQDRIKRIYNAFESAINEHGYKGRYRGVFPIKVNQQRHVVDAIRRYGRDTGLGLEVGSKPELIAAIAMHDDPDALFLCNGYKDADYIELALLAKRLGRKVIIILEAISEVPLVLDLAGRLGIEAELGIRMKPLAKGAGHWEASGGEHAKFGLTTSEIMQTIKILEAQKKTHWITLLHHHIGSQVSAISAIQRVLRESTRMFTELLKYCPELKLFDVGGGLAIDYDGSRTDFHASMNYSVDEYARDIVDAIQIACAEAGVAEPDIITESGRALTAHHAILVVPVVDAANIEEAVGELDPPPSDDDTVQELYELYGSVTVKNCHEAYNDAQNLREKIVERFIQGDITLAERAYADRIYWQLMARLKSVASGLRHVPEDLEKTFERLRDTYFCSFSVFQSVLDIWSIDQLFPVMPIHRLNEEPTRNAIIADMSCDSDGVIEKFIDLKDVKNSLPVHTWKPEDTYYMGIFLVGAYQEILGDLHNLFGDTHAVHLNVSDSGEIEISHLVNGDTVSEVLRYVQYDPADLMERWRMSIEKALKAGTIGEAEAGWLQKRYSQALNSYTYFQV